VASQWRARRTKVQDRLSHAVAERARQEGQPRGLVHLRRASRRAVGALVLCVRVCLNLGRAGVTCWSAERGGGFNAFFQRFFPRAVSCSPPPRSAPTGGSWRSPPPCRGAPIPQLRDENQAWRRYISVGMGRVQDGNARLTPGCSAPQPAGLTRRPARPRVLPPRRRQPKPRRRQASETARSRPPVGARREAVYRDRDRSSD
jgi:hypothetical protein